MRWWWWLESWGNLGLITIPGYDYGIERTAKAQGVNVVIN